MILHAVEPEEVIKEYKRVDIEFHQHDGDQQDLRHCKPMREHEVAPRVLDNLAVPYWLVKVVNCLCVLAPDALLIIRIVRQTQVELCLILVVV